MAILFDSRQGIIKVKEVRPPPEVRWKPYAIGAGVAAVIIAALAAAAKR